MYTLCAQHSSMYDRESIKVNSTPKCTVKKTSSFILNHTHLRYKVVCVYKVLYNTLYRTHTHLYNLRV